MSARVQMEEKAVLNISKKLRKLKTILKLEITLILIKK